MTLLLAVEKECKNIGLGLSAKKTKVMPINIRANEVNIRVVKRGKLSSTIMKNLTKLRMNDTRHASPPGRQKPPHKICHRTPHRPCV